MLSSVAQECINAARLKHTTSRSDFIRTHLPPCAQTSAYSSWINCALQGNGGLPITGDLRIIKQMRFLSSAKCILVVEKVGILVPCEHTGIFLMGSSL